MKTRGPAEVTPLRLGISLRADRPSAEPQSPPLQLLVSRADRLSLRSRAYCCLDQICESHSGDREKDLAPRLGISRAVWPSRENISDRSLSEAQPLCVSWAKTGVYDIREQCGPPQAFSSRAACQRPSSLRVGVACGARWRRGPAHTMTGPRCRRWCRAGRCSDLRENAQK